MPDVFQVPNECNCIILDGFFLAGNKNTQTDGLADATDKNR